MKKHIVVLGAGMVGRAIIQDLSRQHRITAIDKDQKALDRCSHDYGVKTIQQDVSDREKTGALIEDAALVVSAVPGFLGYQTLEMAIRKNKEVVDISFMPEDFMELHALAYQLGVTAITDCGVAPGMPNLIAGYYSRQMEIERFEYMVGGLPRERKFPFEYKAPFSPIDVLEEYTRPARVMENGKVIHRLPLSEPELVYFEHIGHLEAFNTDGLRSLLHTMKHIPHMKEKTLRYPGHIRLIEALKAAGFFSERPVQVEGQTIRPLDVTNQVLMQEWKLKPEEPEFTIMRILLEGGGQAVVYDLYDEYDRDTKLSSMARTTGFTATAAANMLLDGIFKEKGVFPPELIGKQEACFEYIMAYLKERNVAYRLSKG
jgi:saccharopine dehydrogenase-like NADP-dependent oxidoreductase